MKFFKINMDDDEEILTSKRRVNRCHRVSGRLDNFDCRWCVKVNIGIEPMNAEEEFGVMSGKMYKISKESSAASAYLSCLNNGGEDG